MSFDHKDFLDKLTKAPGVYRMVDEQGAVIYVGKAKNLKKRVTSYFSGKEIPVKTRVMVKQIAAIEITVTNTETEALLLENNYIKQLRPRYNVIFRDDKSYPYVFLSLGEYPRLAYHRGAKKGKGEYFGPYPSGQAVRQSLNLLQKLFKVRQCEDSVFNNRSRPCLQYQIKRCKAPCVNYVSQQEYAQDVELSRLFYQGKSERVIEVLQAEMDQAVEELAFEKAAQHRDVIASLRSIVEKQVISGSELDIDVFAFALNSGIAAVVLLSIRGGSVLGTKNYFPKVPTNASKSHLIEAVLTQYYLSGREVPPEVLISESIGSIDTLTAALSEIAKKTVKVASNVRSDRADWMRLAQKNAQQALASKLTLKVNQTQRLSQLQKMLNLPESPNWIECFDISHTQGESTVASCVVFIDGAPDSQKYRKFNIDKIAAGDDYAAINQAVHRRYARLIKETGQLPDLILIDGGKGQLNSALDALRELGLEQVLCVGIAKGSDRKLGMEQFFFAGESIGRIYSQDSPGLHLIQYIRDEAHRFAIAGHRNRRAKTRSKSWLEEIPGVGVKRRQALIRFFGGLKGIEKGSVDDLLKVKGISSELAHKIYDFIHEK